MQYIDLSEYKNAEAWLEKCQGIFLYIFFFLSINISCFHFSVSLVKTCCKSPFSHLPCLLRIFFFGLLNVILAIKHNLVLCPSTDPQLREGYRRGGSRVRGLVQEQARRRLNLAQLPLSVRI